MATLLSGIIGYLDMLVTTVKPTADRKFVLVKLIHLVVQTYHPDVIETFIVHNQDMIQSKFFFK